MPEVKDGRLGRVIVDDRYAPLIISSFIGETDLPLGEWFEETSIRLVRAQGRLRRRVVGIHDTSQAGRTSAEMRKFWADMAKRTPPEVERAMLSNLIVISSPIMRGVLTAVGWLNPEVAKLRTFPSLAAAIDAAIADLRADGSTVTLPPGGYVLPPLPAKASG
jgi:hypothetical protein